MRAVFVVLVEKAVETRLLRAHGRRWRAKRLLLQGAVHALVPSVLLRVTGLNALVTIPSLTHHTESVESPPAPRLAKGVPLSVRIRSGSPSSRKTASKMGCAPGARVSWPRHADPPLGGRVGLGERIGSQHGAHTINGRVPAGRLPGHHFVMTPLRWLGIDFSGNHLKWRPGCKTSNVWVADVRRGEDARLFLNDVRRVQKLPGAGDPFDRLVNLLAASDYVGAGIDAPFSVPDHYASRVGGHSTLLKLVGGLPAVGRPFVTGLDMVQHIAGVTPPLRPPKPMRGADSFWMKAGVNVRSPMWTGTRPGAPMTAACLTLLHRANRPMWPWSHAGHGLLVEAFPAAQLKTWELPHEKYDGNSSAAVATRATILNAVACRVRLGSWGPTLLGSADAIDSLICAFAAVAVTMSKVCAPAGPAVLTEGWVAVHS